MVFVPCFGTIDGTMRKEVGDVRGITAERLRRGWVTATLILGMTFAAGCGGTGQTMSGAVDLNDGGSAQGPSGPEQLEAQPFESQPIEFPGLQDAPTTGDSFADAPADEPVPELSP